jgi:hypothetical protein
MKRFRPGKVFVKIAITERLWVPYDDGWKFYLRLSTETHELIFSMNNDVKMPDLIRPTVIEN